MESKRKFSLYTKQQSSKLVLVFFGFLFLLGCLIFKDYGISWDEFTNRRNGSVTAYYLAKKFFPQSTPQINLENLSEYADKDYGVVFDLPLFLIEKAIGMKDMRSVFLFKHFTTFLFFFLGLVSFFLLINLRYDSRYFAMLGVMMLTLSPRIFADAFYNSKDLLFMSVFLIGIYTSIRLALNPSVGNIILHALSIAVATNVRIIGIILLFTTVLIILLRGIYFRQEPRIISGRIVGLLTMSLGFTFLLWPYLWDDPVTNFLQAVDAMSKFDRWQGRSFYLGHFVPNIVPWHYPWVWIAVTTPPPYLIFFFIGVLLILRNLFLTKLQVLKDFKQLQDLIFCSLFFVPIIAANLKGSVLYNGWRQLYFTYPALILVSLRGVAWINKRSLHYIFTKLIQIGFFFWLAYTLVWMVRAHPLQNVYFNFLGGREPEKKFEVDYWGLANRRALELILSLDPSSQINVWPLSYTPLKMSFSMLKAEQRNRLRLADSKDFPLYYITNYYGVGDREKHEGDISKKGILIEQIKVGPMVVVSIFKAR